MVLSRAKPCPFCGKKPTGIMRPGRREFSLVHECVAATFERGIRVEVRESSEAACIESWNSRASTEADAIATGIEAAAQMFDKMIENEQHPKLNPLWVAIAKRIRKLSEEF